MKTSLRILLSVLLLGSMTFSSRAAETMSLDQLRAARKLAADRQRKVIFNNDGNEPVYLCKDTTAEELLRHRTSPLAGSHVDSIFYCTWSSGFYLFTHDTKVGDLFVTKEGRFSTNMTDKMIAAGTDPLRVMVDWGKKNNVEIFWSFRLNDTHDASTADYGPVMFRANKFKQQHPEWLIGSPRQMPKFGGWTAVDFSHAAIRDLSVKFVEEVCRNYDVDGIEIDFFRHPVFFKRHAQTGTPCNDDERAAMSDMVKRVREVTEAEGIRRGRPILVAFRVPDSVPYCRDIGLDIERWLAAGWLDLLATAGYYQMNPWETSVELARKYGVKYYASLDESRVPDAAAKKLRMTPEAYRGRVLNALHAGANGVYLFNSFDPHNPIWREIGDRPRIARQDQDYFASVRGLAGAAGNAYSHRPFQNIPTLNPKVPITVTAAKPVHVPIRIGNEQLASAAAASVATTLRLQFKTAPSSGDVTISLNGKPLASPQVSGQWLVFSLSPTDVKVGANDVQVAVLDGKPNVEWWDLHVTVRWLQ